MRKLVSTLCAPDLEAVQSCCSRIEIIAHDGELIDGHYLGKLPKSWFIDAPPVAGGWIVSYVNQRNSRCVDMPPCGASRRRVQLSLKHRQCADRIEFDLSSARVESYFGKDIEISAIASAEDVRAVSTGARPRCHIERGRCIGSALENRHCAIA